MRLYRICSTLLVACLGLFGFSSVALATDKPVFSSVFMYAAADLGYQGGSLAVFKAKHAMLTASSQSTGSLAAGLRRDSHGYLLASADDFQGWNQNGDSRLSLT